jgi:SAM-dependent methyltransferase
VVGFTMQGTGQPAAAAQSAPPVIDYEGSRYRTEFWEGQGRQYEDAAERLALHELLPGRGGCVAEIGAGFGRLADLYAGYGRVVLFDYSRSLLREAVQRWGDDPRFVFVAGNVYTLPLASGVLDSLVMVRVMHHLADVPAALAQIRRALHGESVAVLEYANKRNFKALGRWALRRQAWSPLDEQPVEFVALNYDFHPAWMERQLAGAGLTVQRQLAVSHFRMGALKRAVSPQALARVDSWLFGVGGKYPLAPSVFVRATAPQAPDAVRPGGYAVAALLRCPRCQAEGMLVQASADQLGCAACGARIARRDGVWDCKELVN